MPKIIIGLAGQLASGKEEAKKYLEEEHGAGSYRMSSILRDVLNRLYIPIERINLQSLSLALRDCFGSDTLARVIAEDAKNDSHEIVIIDGVRRLDDIVKLKDLPNFYLVSIDADPKIRYERMKLRNENGGDAEKSYAQFLEDGAREAELQIPEVMSKAKFKINNNGSKTELYKQLEDMLTTLEK